MKAVLLSLVLIGCSPGDYKFGLEEEEKNASKEENQSNVDPEGAGAGTTRSGTSSTDEDLTKALIFSYIEIEGISRLTSSAKIINTLYFTGADSLGNRVLGRVKPGSSKPDLIPFGQFSANNITLRDEDYFIPTNLDDFLYLMNDTEIVQIDLTTLLAIGRTTSECAIKSPLTYIKEARWNMIWSSKVVECGMVDGVTISKAEAMDGYTAQPLNFDNFSSFNFDSENIWRFSPRQKQLVRYGQDFAKEEVYSTSGFLYSNDQATFVSDSNGGMWFFGCVDESCFVATAEIAEQ